MTVRVAIKGSTLNQKFKKRSYKRLKVRQNWLDCDVIDFSSFAPHSKRNTVWTPTNSCDASKPVNWETTPITLTGSQQNVGSIYGAVAIASSFRLLNDESRVFSLP